MIESLAFGMAVSLSSFVVAAETTVYSKAAARSGEPARVAYYFTVSANCKVSSLPISVAAAPAHGVAVVKELKSRQSAPSAVAKSKGQPTSCTTNQTLATQVMTH